MIRIIGCFLVLLALLTACDTTERDIQRTQSAESGVGPLGERFQVAITGDIEADITPGFSQYYFAEDLGVWQLLLHDGQESIYRVVLLIPQPTETGTYQITHNVQNIADIDGIKASLAGPRDVANFSINTSGTITLTRVGSTISGSFTFTASNLDNQSVTVSGTFDNVPRND